MARTKKAPTADSSLNSVPQDSLQSFLHVFLRWHEPRGTPLCPNWPPDLFAVVAYVLYQTGEYRRITQPSFSGEPQVGASSEWAEARRAGREWRASLDSHIGQHEVHPDDSSLSDALAGSPILEWWARLMKHADRRLSELGSDPVDINMLFRLFFAADEACAGIGRADPIRRNDDTSEVTARGFHDQAVGLMQHLNGNRSLCMQVDPDVVSVLPKLHTAQVGLTLRSLSHNLALCSASGIKSYWNGPYTSQCKGRDSLNLLLLPWPDDFQVESFLPVATNGTDDVSLPKVNAHFGYAPKRMSVPEFRARLERAITKAQERSGEIHAVVLPELALDIPMYLEAEEVAWRHRLMLIAGVQESHNDRHQNLCAIQPLGLLDRAGKQRTRGLAKSLAEHRIVQSKHHRWCLERNQILQYRLGGRLPASKKWWEHIEIPERRVNFVALGNWLTWCALVCEDLARQDPVAQVIRAVGPNLVIALLMDGPQLQQRWPARYASVLAEDPGSSVLTLSNLGMVRRCQPLSSLQSRDQPVVDSVVALWSDRIHGTREIALKEGEDACVLNLVCHSEHEFTADGHTDEGNGHFVVYAGHHTFGTAEARPPRRRTRKAAKAS
jgi:hypothetical protein